MGAHNVVHPSLGPCLPIALIVLVIAVGGIMAVYTARKRREALTTLAAELGFAFHPDRDDSRLRGRFDQIDLLRQGSNRYTQNHLVGRRDGYPVAACDYHYEVRSGKSTHHYTYGVVFVIIPLRMPEVRIRCEGWFDKIAAAVGFEDIDFESAEFSKHYYVAAADRKFAYDLIHARAIEYLLEHPDYSWEFEGDTIAIYKRTWFEPQQIKPAIETAVGFVRLIPEFVWQERGTSTREDRHVT